jgi:PPOX class probable F420-dependent enzyme
MAVLDPGVAEFLRGPHVASLATVRPNGRPHVTPVWYQFDGHEFILSTLREAQKIRNITWKGYASLAIHTAGAPFQHVVAEGPARVGSPLDNVWRERLAIRYLGETAGRAYVRESGDWDVVAIHIRPVKWSTQGFETS